MTPAHIRQLERLLQFFPGIGPRQAARFAYSLLDRDAREVANLGELICSLHGKIGRCSICGRVIELPGQHCTACSKGAHIARLIIVEKDQDIEAIDRIGLGAEATHILGGLLFSSKQEAALKERMKALYDRVHAIITQRDLELEIIVALAPTSEGEATAQYIARILSPFIKMKKLKISRLARGLSSGSELEYADSETLKHAFENRK